MRKTVAYILILSVGLVLLLSKSIQSNANGQNIGVQSNKIMNSKGRLLINDYFEFDSNDIEILNTYISNEEQKLNQLLNKEE